MAETFIAIGASISAAASATAASVSALFTGGAAATGSAAAAGTATTASSLSTALSIGSALSSIAGGFMSAEAQKDQARQVGVQIAQQKAADSQKRASMAEEYAEIVADQTAVQLVNGLNPGVGTPATVRAATREFSERNLSVSRENTRNRAAAGRAQQRSLYKGANTALLGGFTQAAATGAQAYQAVG